MFVITRPFSLQNSTNRSHLVFFHLNRSHNFSTSPTAALHNYVLNNATEVNIAIGINGIPLSKSSGGQFWPILGYLYYSSKFIFKNVFSISIPTYIMALKTHKIVMSFFQILLLKLNYLFIMVLLLIIM